ncbi:MAG: EF-P beta-lysylation protein EpmB [Gammaproteobacteria bacterium]
MKDAIITRTATAFQPEWQNLLANAISSPMELLHQLDLHESPLAQQLDIQPDFRLRVPVGFVEKMKKGDPNDPLLLQVLPLAKENIKKVGFISDPVGDLASEVVPGVLHKYQGRALLVTTGACGIHCRYCFRRHFPYGDSNPSTGQWQTAIDYISSSDSINEVLLSGGDPLSLTDKKLAILIAELNKISHVKRLRIHTRMPVVLPERIDNHFLDLIKSAKQKVIMVIHANHANEIDHNLQAVMDKLTKAGVTLLNQSVLLRGINDTAESLVDLSEKLFEINVMPYYLHLLDPVQGAAHFNIEREEATTIMESVRDQLPGYLVPKLVWEKPGANSKLAII